MRHTPVLLTETLNLLRPTRGEHFIDATLGAGGHAQAILDRTAPDGTLLGLDRDPHALSQTTHELARFSARATFVHGSFDQLESIATKHGFASVDGILFDLGLSSMLVADPTRGFSFQSDGPLDMRFDPTEDTPTAADLVNTLSAAQLRSMLRTYGEEPHAERIANAIVQQRKKQKLSTTRHLLLTVLAGSRARGPRHHHPATRTFQALRIAVNRELEQLEAALPQAVALLAPGGRLAVVSFHSLEDRIVKQFFKRESKGCLCPPEFPVCTCGHRASIALLTTHALTPSREEQRQNPRSRSAKLRGITKRTPAL
ncbi:MAG: 16S rRNA (cytosine(1402)-N(4))-methyltransferase RsmH [Candidatus Kerfeldbacteria bacterium]|nr:16S rRNA (cytosine(1402)-N(4))-methyltransferase RsmH [Candidatus Kerfeldbacteria bacterium]